MDDNTNVILAGYRNRCLFTFGGVAKDDLIEIVQRHGYIISESALDLISRETFCVLPTMRSAWLCREKIRNVFPVKKEGHKIFFARLSDMTTSGIGEQLDELGHALCPPEAALHARLQLADQVLGDRFFVPTRPLLGSDGIRRIFEIYTNLKGERWLDAREVEDWQSWSPECIVAFLLGGYIDVEHADTYE